MIYRNTTYFKEFTKCKVLLTTANLWSLPFEAVLQIDFDFLIKIDY